MVALGVVLLLTNVRAAVVYGVTLAVVGLPALWLSNHASDGWFWTYTSVLHRKHDFFAARAFIGTPGRLLLILGPAVLLVPWALVRRRTPGLVFATFIALVGIFAACLSFGTQWAFTNAFMPGVMLPAIAIGVAAGRLLDDGPRLRPAAVYLLLSLSIICGTGALLPIAGRTLPKSWQVEALQRPTGLDPRVFLPTARDRQLGDALILRLRATDGEVLIPFHPFYGYLAGKRTYLHRMGVMDTWRAGMGAPRGLSQALAEKRFSLIVMDDKIENNWFMWPGLLESYRILATLDGPPVVSGSETRPKFLLVPNVINTEIQ
jgi:hypothetical protein